MPYTRSWQESAPTDADLRSQVDDFFRNLKVDIRERMNDSLVEDWTADPVIPKSSVGGKVNGKSLYLPGTAFQGYATSVSGTLSFINGRFSLSRSGNSVGAFGYAPLDLPHNTEITGLYFAIDNPGDQLVSLRLRRRPWSISVGTLETVNAISSTDSNVQGAVIATHTVDPGYLYLLEVEYTANTGDFNFTTNLYGVRVVYNTPDARYVR